MTPTPHKEKMTCDGKCKCHDPNSLGESARRCCDACSPEKKTCLCGGTGYVDTGKGAEGPCPACHPEKEKREDAGEEWEKEFDFLQVSGTDHAEETKEFIRTLISRTRKEAEQKAWRKAMEAVGILYCPLHAFTGDENDALACEYCNKSARQQLIQAAKEHGVNIEV